MKSKKKNLKFLYVLLTMFLLVITVISGRFTLSALSAFADTSEYTDVLEDLQKDESFNVSDYPDNPKDYSIQVIQIAESTNGELFVYTYQPAQKFFNFTATEINMSLTDKLGVIVEEELNGADRPKLYSLTLLNSNGVFVKYKVNDFSVSADDVRYYNITSIYREWNGYIDYGPVLDNTTNAVAYPVGKLFKAFTFNGEVLYSCEDITVIQIVNPWAGFIRYNNGFLFYTSACDSHFVAFSTDMKIDELYEADLSYQTRSVHDYFKNFSVVKDYGKAEPKTAYLTDDQRYSETATGWLWGQDRDYNRIQSVTEFIKTEELTDEAKSKLNGKQWVLRFAETDFTETPDSVVGSLYGDKRYTEVSSVTVLRLKFKSAGVVYNIGAVSDKVTGDDIPENPQPDGLGDKINQAIKDFFKGIWDSIVGFFKNLFSRFTWWQWLLIFFGVIIGIGLIIAFIVGTVKFGIKSVFKGILWLIKKLVKAVWWIISLPFRAIFALFRKGK